MCANTDTVRAFVAVELPQPIQEHLEAVQARLRQEAATRVLRWVAPHLTHVTLKFLGEVEVTRLEAISLALARVAAGEAPFDVTLGELGAFPNVYRPRVVWIGVQDPEARFRWLARSVEQALAKLGFESERRGPFVPHITLGRVQRRATASQRRALGELIGGVEVPTGQAFAVNHVTLMRSVLTPEGPVYTRLAHHQFGQ